MTCTDFRRASLAQLRSPEANAHATSCAACRRYVGALRAENERLRRALAVEVPPGLADRVLLARRRGRPRRAAWAAAGFAAAVAVLLAVTVWPDRDVARGSADLAADLVDHVAGEPGALAATGTLPADRLTAALSAAGVTSRRPLGEVRSATWCRMGGGMGQHLVVDTERGRVTIFVTPRGTTVPRRRHLARGGYHVELLPGRDATVAVVASERHATEAVVSLLETS